MSFVESFIPSKADFNNQTSFDAFLKEFSSDSVYQIDHVIFPVEYQSLNDEYGAEIRSISKSNYKLLDFRNDHLAARREFDAYEIKIIRVSNEQVTYLRSGIDNGILVEFHFKLYGGEWYLTKISNKST